MSIGPQLGQLQGMDIDELIQLMIEAGLDPSQIGVATEGIETPTETPAQTVEPAMDVPDPAQSPPLIAEETMLDPLELELARMAGEALPMSPEQMPTLPAEGQLPREPVDPRADLGGLANLLANARAAEQRVQESPLSAALPSLPSPSAPEPTEAEIVEPEPEPPPEEMLGAEIGDKTPGELELEEKDLVRSTLDSIGVGAEITQAVTGEGEAGAAAQETGMSIGEILLAAAGAGLISAGLAAALGKDPGKGFAIGAVGGLSAGFEENQKQRLLRQQQAEEFRQLDRRELTKERIEQMKMQDAMRQEQAKRDREAYLAAMRGDFDWHDPQNAEIRQRAERYIGSPFTPTPEAPIRKDPMDKINRLSLLAQRLDDQGLRDESAKVQAEIIRQIDEAELSPDYETMELEQALSTFAGVNSGREERVRAFKILAPRLVREGGVDKTFLKELAKQRGIHKVDEVKDTIETAVGEVPGPERGQ